MYYKCLENMYYRFIAGALKNKIKKLKKKKLIVVLFNRWNRVFQ